MNASLPLSNHFLPIAEIPQGHNPFKTAKICSSVLFCCCNDTAKRAAQLLSTQNVRPFLDSAEAFLFDCDGVIWKGDKLIDGEDGEKRIGLNQIPSMNMIRVFVMVQLLPRVGAVVVGIDPRINCYKLQYGTLCMREKPGCIFIATNRDLAGRAGCMVAAACGSTERGPITVGNARPKAHNAEKLAGVTTKTTLQDPSNNVQPDYYTSKVSDLPDLLVP
ncbi:hypothetical protein POTOM_024479 [Populus tomentosa]|uniref:Uncharacterized protein n=1 Tax=Populus tomentosa TaxID=118781 RepID=A0A8X7ZJA8_POPTO|nr:hypothetical protein POTOM_024479 [Populus tomentosa]